MRRERRVRILLAVAAALLGACAAAQPTYTIAIGQTASGTIATDATTHAYLLDVPAGLQGLTIEVRGGDRDADLAVYFGDEELYSDWSTDPNPVFALASPRAGRYRIEVLNLLWQELPYTIRVTSGPVAGTTVAPGSTWSAPGVAAGAIELGGTRTGVIPAAELYRAYTLDVPSGTLGFTVRLTAGGADADMAVYFGNETLFDDVSVDPNPVFTLTNPRPGTYTVVVKNLITSDLNYVLTVEAQGATPVRPGVARLEVGVGEVAPGAPIVVRFSGTPGNARDWIGLYQRGAEDRAYRDWKYTTALTSGQLTFMAPAEPGTYEFRLFENDGYTRLAASGTFDVVVATRPTPPSAAVPVTCTTTARDDVLRDVAVGTSVQVTCPAGCSSGESVWGTDAYTDDSRVCTAAAHAGVLDLARGGTVALTIAEGRGGYEASTRNGVTTRSWGAWSRSFTFAAATGPGATTTPLPTAGTSVSATSDAPATLRTTEGVVVEVPAGAVPARVDGGVGTMVFSSEPATRTPQPPAGFAAVGPFLQIGPENLRFEQPVALTFPIPAGVDPATVAGLTTFDEAENAWVVVPGVVDPVARTVTVWTDHFSPWGVAIRQTPPRSGGILRIGNASARGGMPTYTCEPDDPNCQPGLPTSHGYGLCMTEWSLVNPSERFWGVRDGMSRVATARDGQTIDWWLPDGTYLLEPFFHMSQVNQSPLYVPRHQMWVAPAVRVTVRDGQVVAFGNDWPGEYVQGWTRCHGGEGPGTERERITSVGTGDVQVTLTWQAEIDVDLYVTDPAGETVYYGNRRVASGGELDRDNMCGDFEWGRPENVYWPQGGAPAGEYVVKVRYYGSCVSGDPSVAWTVRVVVGGTVQSYTGTLAPYDEQTVTTFRVR